MASSHFLMGSVMQRSTKNTPLRRRVWALGEGVNRPQGRILCVSPLGWSQPLALRAPGFGAVSWWGTFGTTPPVWHRSKSPGPQPNIRSSRFPPLWTERSSIFSSPAPIWALTLETPGRLPRERGVQAGCRELLLCQHLPWEGIVFPGEIIRIIFLGIQTTLEGKGTRVASWVVSFCIKVEVRLQSSEANLFCFLKADANLKASPRPLAVCVSGLRAHTPE